MILLPTNNRIIRPYDKPSFEHTQRYGLIKGHPLGKEGGLVFLGAFNEGSGPQVLDLSGKASGALVSSVAWDAGISGRALSFPVDGTGYISVNNYSITDNLTQYTWVIRCCPMEAGGGNYGRLVTKANGINEVLTDYSHELSAQRQTSGTNAYSRSVGDLFEYGDWHSFGITYNDTGDRLLHLFMDAAEIPSYETQTAATGTLSSDSASFYIGNRPGGDRQFEGMIDSIHLYGRVLSASEIALVICNPFCMVERRVSTPYFFVPSGAPPTGKPYYYREFASRRIA